MAVLSFPGAAPLSQPEIFGRFILVSPVGEQSQGPQTFRALDLDRELRPVVAVTRLPPFGSFDKKERIAFVAAAEQHARCTDEAIAAYVDHGDVDGVAWRAAEWVPGVSVAALLQSFGADDDKAELPASFTTSVAYILGSALLDAENKRSDNILVSLQPRPTRVLLHFDGRVSVLGPTLRLTRPGADEARYTVDDGEFVDAAHLARFFFELCTGLVWTPGTPAETRGPRGRLPAELLRLTRLAIEGKSPLRDYVLQIQPLMHAAGGGHYSHIAEVVRARLPDAHAEHDRQVDRDLALARRLRLRRRPRAMTKEDRVTRKLRIRPASQEGPAVLEVDTEVPQEMVLVSGGRFLFSPVDEAPAYVDVKPFLLDRHPVTCGEYARFCQETKHTPPLYWPQPLQVFPDPQNLTDALRDAPVVEVSRVDAEAFAAWAGKRLPSEVEWELAARGFDGRMWPYGNEFDEKKSGSDWREPWKERELPPVTQLEPEAASPFGITGLGCAWEWTSTPAGELASSSWVVRGGAWRDRVEPPTLVNRSYEDGAAPDVMFRCARDVDDDDG
jgi:formylglycine-generating enzyme required for sulfatase activity